MYEQIMKPKEKKSNAATQKKGVVKQGSGFVGNRLETYAQRKLQLTLNNSPIQYIKKGGKQQAGMPAKSKHGSKEKQQSKAQRAFNAFQSYRGNFFNSNNVTVTHVNEYLTAGNKLHGHGSSSGVRTVEKTKLQEMMQTILLDGGERNMVNNASLALYL